MNKEELIEIVQKSFLSTEKKRELIDLLNTKISKEEFFDFLNNALIDAVDQRVDIYHRAKKYMDDAFERIDEARTRLKTQRDEALEKSLAEIDPAEFEKKKALLDTYYTQTQKANAADEEDIKTAIADTIKLTFVELT